MLVLAFSVHESAHAYVAMRLGDPTARLRGRVSLNPLVHADWIGTILFPLLALASGLPLIGWAKPVPVATGALRNPRFTLFMVCLAGPVANLLMIALWCVALGMIVRVHGNATLIRWIALMSQAGIKANTMLALFHLAPIPPFDCGRVIAGLLPPTVAARFERVEPVGFLIVIGLAALHLFDWLLTPANRLVGHIVGLLLGTAA